MPKIDVASVPTLIGTYYPPNSSRPAQIVFDSAWVTTGPDGLRSQPHAITAWQLVEPRHWHSRADTVRSELTARAGAQTGQTSTTT